MRSHQSIFLYIGVCIFLGIVSYLLWVGVRWKLDHPVLGVSTASTTTLRKESLASLSHGAFKHYYGLVPGVMALEKPDWMPITPVYTINTDGLNDRFDYSKKKPDDAFRILTLGDSFTFGEYVTTQENYSEVLEDMLNRQQCAQPRVFEVINLGVPGYDIAYTVTRFLEKGIPYHPDLVIWLINGHNMYQLVDVMQERVEELNRSLTADEIAEARRNGEYYKAVSQAQQDLMNRFGVQALLRQQLVYFRQFADSYAGPLVIALFDDMTDPPISDTIHGFAAERQNTKIYQGLPALVIPATSYPDRHPNAAGHQVIAEHILSYLSQEGLYSCR